jgi:YrbI family 3-deoxy-D-manno-octulosonate 8-phosphate phosphatase
MPHSNTEAKLSEIKILVMDVDGTMTDGAMYYNESGEALKRFSARDGMGITLLHNAGIETGIITSVNSHIAKARATKLQMKYIKLDRFDKDKAIQEISLESGVPVENIAFIGDDVNDISGMKLAGFSAAPADANDETKSIVDYVCVANGGKGAIREIAEKILIGQKKSVILNY